MRCGLDIFNTFVLVMSQLQIRQIPIDINPRLESPSMIPSGVGKGTELTASPWRGIS